MGSDIININKSFKAVITAKQKGYIQVINEKEYTYDEFNELYNKKKTEKDLLLKKKYKQLDHFFIDEHTPTICNFLNALKDENCSKGFLNDMNYTDIINLVMNNINVNEIINEGDENDQSFDEDDYY